MAPFLDFIYAFQFHLFFEAFVTQAKKSFENAVEIMDRRGLGDPTVANLTKRFERFAESLETASGSADYK